MALLLSVLTALLAVSCLFHFHAHNKVLVQCKVREDTLKERLQHLSKAILREKSGEDVDVVHQQLARVSNTVGLIGEVLKARTSSGEGLCNEKLTACQEDMARLNATASHGQREIARRLDMCIKEMSSLRADQSRHEDEVNKLQGDSFGWKIN